MKPRLIILSDLWGFQKSEWEHTYADILSQKFEIQKYDCCELANIDTTMYIKKEALHKQFVEGGIEIAVKKLVALEKSKIHILAFSIGGTIAWEAGLKGLKIDGFYAVSSTRLRHQKVKSTGFIKLFFGSKDLNRPLDSWSKKLSVDCNLVKNGNHEMYMENNFAI